VGVRNNQEMAADVRIKIQDHKIVSAPAQYESAFVFAFILMQVAKNTGRRIRLFTST